MAFSIVGLTALTLVAVSSAAWFSSGVDVSFGADGDVPVTAGAYAAYYGGGDGSSATPYIISNRTHLYNLAWLQYIGVYNTPDIEQHYFKVTKDLDMTGLTLPPIGTDKYPFLSNFNGDNHTISNLVVSNDDPHSDGSDFGVAKPSDIPAAATQPKIVGFFGVVGNPPTNDEITYDSSIVSIKNINLNTLTVKSKTSETLIGLAAGYVDGTMSGVKVSGNSSLILGDSSKSIVSNEITNKLSDYALVGYTAQTTPTAGYSQDLSEYRDLEGESSEQNANDWGGSVDARAINRFIYDAFKYTETNTSDASYGMEKSRMAASASTANTKTTDDYNLAFTASNRTVPYKKTSYTYYMDPDCYDSPRDGKQATNKPKFLDYKLKQNNYIPLKLNEDQSGTASDNTGYLVGSTNGSPITSSNYQGMIGNSLSNTYATYNTWYYDTTTEFVDKNLELLTYSLSDDHWYRIGDTHNANRGGQTTNTAISGFAQKDYNSYLHLQKYADSRNNLQTILETSSRLNAIRFENDTVSASNKLTIDSNIKINGKTYGGSNGSYQLLNAAINFNCKSAGFINLFAATYDSGNITNFSFFTLHHVIRTGGTIDSVKKISKVYQNKYWTNSSVTNANTNPKFFYQYSDGSFSNIVVSGSSRVAQLSDRDTSVGVDGLMADMSKTLECVVGASNSAISTINNVMFYFEIPINDGDYAIGMVPKPNGINGYAGAHLIYLDIGSNGDVVESDEVHAYSITTRTQGNVYPIGVDFAVASVGATGGYSMGVSIPNSKSGTVSFDVNASGTSIVITGGSISSFAFQGSKYNNGFTVSGSSPGNPPSPPVGGTRAITILIKSSSTTTTATITDIILDGSGSFNENNSTYSINGVGNKTKADVLALSTLLTEDEIANIRSLTIAASLVRKTGTNQFTTIYDTENCSYANKIVDVDITLNGTTLFVSVTDGYTFRISGNAAPTSYPS